MIKQICKVCKKEFWVKPYRIKEKCKYCSYKCYWKSKKGIPFYSQWKGGRTKNSEGYILIKNREHPFCNCEGYIFEHRLVSERQIGRYLKPEETVHHINGIITDNRIENLMVFVSKSAHIRFHKNPSKINSSEITFDGR